MMRMMPVSKIPPKPYFIIALRLVPRGVGNFLKFEEHPAKILSTVLKHLILIVGLLFRCI